MKNYFFHPSKQFVFFVVAVLSLAIWLSCENNYQSPTEPAKTQAPVILSKDNPEVRAVMAVQNQYTEILMQHSEVVGTATGLSADGSKPAIWVLTKIKMETASLQKSIPVKNLVANGQIPAFIDGIPVVCYETGELKPLRSSSTPSGHTAMQTPPIQLGTSGGWGYDLANGYCCAGTLGSLLTDGGSQYILSNYHVLMADIVPGGNGIVATAGDPVIQPGLIDVSCNINNAQQVASIVENWSLPGSNVDAAIAQVVPGMVRSDGAILEIGTLSAQTVDAYIGLDVKKSGRTTGLTRGTVSALNGTVSITYEDECAGETAFTKTFTGQIIVNQKRSSFLDSGDSGSLMVEDEDSNPGAVGLLFAGSSKTAIANPIDEVLTYFGMSMVGN